MYHSELMLASFTTEFLLPATGLVLCIVILTIGANWLVEGAAKLAYRLGIPKIIVGATVVSLGTTSPEAGVSVLAAIQGHAGLALGNAIGSVICDTGLIFGLSCLMTRLPLDRFILNRHGWIQFGAGLLLVVMAYLSEMIFGYPVIPRPVGIFFLALLMAYMFVSVRWARQHPAPSEEIENADKPVWLCLLMVVIGLGIVIQSSEWLIESGRAICLYLKVPESVIAATGIALGTSLPELATAISSIRKGHPEILIGNIVGADILNILFVVGASATAVALPVPSEVFRIYFPVMILILVLFRIFIAINKKSFSRLCGIPLLLIYLIFLFIVFS